MSDAIEAEARSVGIREWAPLAVISFKDYERRKAEIAAQLLVACRTAGFFYIVDHGLPTEEIEKMYGLIRGVHALPLEEHVRYKSSAAQDGNYHGYVGSDKIKDGVTAYFNVAAPGTGLAKPMPPVMQTSKPAIDFFQEKVLDVNDRLLQLLSVSMQLPEDYFSKLHNRNAVSGSHLRFMWYPTRDETKDKEIDNVRVFVHSDYGAITMMFSPKVVALQVLDNRDSKTWRYVKPLDNALVCNIGDTLQFLTGGVLKSTQHRVTRPPLPSQSNQTRYNLIYFLRADDHAKLIPPPSPLVPESAASLPGMGMTAGEWVAARVKATVKSSGYGSAEDKGEDEAKKEYNRLQALINRNQGAEQIEKPFARI